MTLPSVFISYSHKDEKEKETLLSHLDVLQQAGLIDLWSDDRIGAGRNWEQEINQAIGRARIAILLVTANFLTSDFILQQEVPALLKRRQSEGLIIFPVIAKACAWREVDWLAKMSVRPKNGKPVWGDGGSHVDEDLTVIAEEIAAIIQSSVSEDQLPAYVVKSHGVPEKSAEQEYQVLWQTQIPLKPQHLFASPDYVCLVTNKTLHFLSPTNGAPLLPPLTAIGNFSLTDYALTGGAVTPSGSLLLTLLPPHSPDKARLLALKLTRISTAQPANVSVQWIYKAPSSQLSSPIIDNKTAYLIQGGPELVALDLERGQVQRVIPLPTSYNLHQDCVSFAFATSYLCLALCDGIILALDPETGQIVATLYERPEGEQLSPLTTNGLRLFFGLSPDQKSASPSYVCALDVISGQEVWKFPMPPGPSGQHRSIEGQPLVVNKTLYVTGRNHYLHALVIDTGQELWHYEMPNRIKLGPVWTGTAVIAADQQGNLHALSATETDVTEFDVFLAHNSQDKPQVETIAGELKRRGLRPWLDKEQIPPGRWFQDIIQQAITQVKSAAIFIGPSGLGKWQALELRSFISQCVEADLPVIPVLLPGVNNIPEKLLFLKELNWVRFTHKVDDAEALDNLEWGITGKHPQRNL